jgi:hypothetical protein
MQGTRNKGYLERVRGKGRDARDKGQGTRGRYIEMLRGKGRDARDNGQGTRGTWKG